MLDTEMKRFTHNIRMAAFDTVVALAGEIRANTGHKRSNRDASNLVTQILTQQGNIDQYVLG